MSGKKPRRKRIRLPVFDLEPIKNPAELESIQTLCEEGFIPYSMASTRAMCRDGTFPALRCGQDWKTTREFVRHYFTLKSNTLFRQYLRAKNIKP